MTPLEKVREQLLRYEHLLADFSAEEAGGEVELVIRLKNEVAGAHVYRAPIHPRDIEGSQFAWNFQRYLYDCLHDFLVELFTRTPQSRDDK